MARPSGGVWTTLKMIGSYLIHRPRVAHLYRWQLPAHNMSDYVGSKWVGCFKTSKSTTGMAILHGGHLLRSISRTRSNIALSLAEAELYAMVRGGSESIGMNAMGLDFGLCLTPHVYVDVSGAIGIEHRKGLGKVRHLDTQSLWIQDELRERRPHLDNVAGAQNAGVMMTNALDWRTLEKITHMVALAHLAGRPTLAPQLTTDLGGELEAKGES